MVGLSRMALVVGIGARQVSGHAAHRAPAQCLRRGDGSTSGPPARTVTGSARVCRTDDTVDLGVGIGPDNAGNAVPPPTSTAQAGGSFIRLERGAPIGPVDVITAWPSNVLNPTSPSTKRPRPPRQTEPDLEPCAMTDATVFGTAPALASGDTRGPPPPCRPQSRARSWGCLQPGRPPVRRPRRNAGRLMTLSVSPIPITIHKQTDTHHDH